MATENFFTDLQAFMAQKDHNTTVSQGIFLFGAMRAAELGHNWHEVTVEWNRRYGDVRIHHNYPGMGNDMENEALKLLSERAAFSSDRNDRVGMMQAKQGTEVAEGKEWLNYLPSYATIYLTTSQGPGRIILVAFFNPEARRIIIGGDKSAVTYYANVVHEVNALMNRKCDQLLAALPLKEPKTEQRATYPQKRGTE